MTQDSKARHDRVAKSVVTEFLAQTDSVEFLIVEKSAYFKMSLTVGLRTTTIIN